MKKRLLAIALLCCVAFAGYSQFSLTGEIRPRTEMYNGNNSTLAAEEARLGFATQQRSRLYFNYMSESGVKIVFSPQLIHFWGQMPQAYDLLGDGAPGAPETNFSVFEAYAEYKASDKYTLKVGRQAISYNDQRWFGALGWAASSRAHDAFVNKFTFGDIKLDVGFALNQTKHVNAFDSAANAAIRAGYKSMQYAWLTLPGSESFKFQAMVTNVSRNSTGNSEAKYDQRTTFGLFPSYKTDGLKANLSAYYQSGTNLRSYLVAVDVTFKAGSTPITIGADIVSGDDDGTDDSETWQQPFGTNHKFYGFMDFFYVGETPAFGLNDIYAKTVLKTGEKTKLIVMPHIFMTNTDATLSESGYLGSELDLIFNYNVAAGFNFKLGYSKLFAADLFEEFKAGDAGAGNQWAWMQLTFKPKFL